ncbi:hypothetical protein [Halorientalis sp.]|jgi:hypothetical protein|uniref:hypothetical protein n=1 Tax=Halorientalis sp. TaxID=1931229 RepID=UPI0026071D8A|nr:hypothetical protein [Halorientalis sp.]
MTGASSPAAVGAYLDALRTAPRRRRLATAGAIVAGLTVVLFHWLGFVLGGALVALAQPSLRRGLAAGLAFGVLAWLAFTLWLALMGDLALYVGMGQVLAVSTVLPLAGSLLGALARGVR